MYRFLDDPLYPFYTLKDTKDQFAFWLNNDGSWMVVELKSDIAYSDDFHPYPVI